MGIKKYLGGQCAICKRKLSNDKEDLSEENHFVKLQKFGEIHLCDICLETMNSILDIKMLVLEHNANPSIDISKQGVSSDILKNIKIDKKTNEASLDEEYFLSSIKEEYDISDEDDDDDDDDDEDNREEKRIKLNVMSSLNLFLEYYREVDPKKYECCDSCSAYVTKDFVKIKKRDKDEDDDEDDDDDDDEEEKKYLCLPCYELNEEDDEDDDDDDDEDDEDEEADEDDEDDEDDEKKNKTKLFLIIAAILLIIGAITGGVLAFIYGTSKETKNLTLLIAIGSIFVISFIVNFFLYSSPQRTVLYHLGSWMMSIVKLLLRGAKSIFTGLNNETIFYLFLLYFGKVFVAGLILVILAVYLVVLIPSVLLMIGLLFAPLNLIIGIIRRNR